MTTQACENGMRELTVDELDAVAGGMGGAVGAAVQIAEGVIHTVAQVVGNFVTASHKIVSC